MSYIFLKKGKNKVKSNKKIDKIRSTVTCVSGKGWKGEFIVKSTIKGANIKPRVQQLYL